MEIQFENGNKSPFRTWKESSWKLENLEITKIDKWRIKKIKVHLEIGKKVHENSKNCKLADEK